MKNDRRNKKVRNYIIICAMLAIILSVSTYAWFIGLQDVKVNSFDVTIKAADSLRLSLDGHNFTDTLTINEAAVTTELTATYANNTNAWATNGLTPVSTIGQIDTTSSTMKIFEKASLTASPDDATAGGYRLLSSRVNNYTVADGKYSETSGYYVVFDLFIENSSGTEYYQEKNLLNEEAIYLLTDSSVTVAADGVANTGIENSVRVGFAQIGRMIKGSDTAIQAATCAGGANITGICYTATIWEPNDTAHVQGAINWYSESCAVRTGEDLYDNDSYGSTSCQVQKPIQNGTSYDTSAVAREVAIADYVDIYDGYYNTYTDSVSSGEYDGTSPLYEVDYFTDTEKNLTGTSRPTFFTLAPNSLTKVRVYVWIEGQDIDNYDYAMAGKTISVNFGFTKERFETTDVSYNGPFIETDVTTITGPLSQANCEAIGGTFANNGNDDATDDTCTVSYGRYTRAVEETPAVYSASGLTATTAHKTVTP